MGGITMVEAGAKEVPESLVVDAARIRTRTDQEIGSLPAGGKGEGGQPKLEITRTPSHRRHRRGDRRDFYGEIYEAK